MVTKQARETGNIETLIPSAPSLDLAEELLRRAKPWRATVLDLLTRSLRTRAKYCATSPPPPSISLSNFCSSISSVAPTISLCLSPILTPTPTRPPPPLSLSSLASLSSFLAPSDPLRPPKTQILHTQIAQIHANKNADVKPTLP